jgi:hypothetical protein
MININIDSDDLNSAVLDVVDSLTVHGLKQAREGLVNDYLNAKSGNGYNVFVVGDSEADAFEISRRIEAFDMVLDYFTLNHESYDFDEDK